MAAKIAFFVKCIVTWKNSGIDFFGHNQQTYCQHYGIGMLKIQNGCQKYDFEQKCSKVQFKTIVSQGIVSP